MRVITVPNVAHDGFALRTSLAGASYKGFSVHSVPELEVRGSCAIKVSNKDTTAVFFGCHDFTADELSGTSTLNIAKGFGFYKAPGDDALIFRIKVGANTVDLALGDIAADTWYKLEFRVTTNYGVRVWVNDEYKGVAAFTVATLPADTDALGGALAVTSTGTAQPTLTYRRAWFGQVRG